MTALFFNAAVLGAQVPFAGMSAESAFLQIADTLEDKAELPLGDLVTEVALLMCGTPYEAGTLELVPEQLVVRYDATDCMIFVETCYATALALKGVKLTSGGPVSGDPSYETLCCNVRMLRYEGGEVDWYKREHYFSGWLRNAASLGVLKEYSSNFGKPLSQDFSYMSSHNPAKADGIAPMEAGLRKFQYFWVPKTDIGAAESTMKNGDIVCFVTDIKGLDVTHVGIVCKNADGTVFIHASSAAGKVLVDKRSIQAYAKYGIRLAGER